MSPSFQFLSFDHKYGNEGFSDLLSWLCFPRGYKIYKHTAREFNLGHNVSSSSDKMFTITGLVLEWKCIKFFCRALNGLFKRSIGAFFGVNLTGANWLSLIEFFNNYIKKLKIFGILLRLITLYRLFFKYLYKI